MKHFVLLCAFIIPVLSGCQFFLSGLCAGPADCMCTLGTGCAAQLTQAQLDTVRLGGCSGTCRQIAHGQCGGNASCLNNVGACGGGGGCLQPCGTPCACCGKPSNNLYYLTSFDGTSCSCGSCHQYGNFFAADRQRFSCGATLHVCRGTKCVTVRVTDYGPSCFVETNAGGPVLDASPAVCQSLFGSSSCGWSDHYSVSVVVAVDGSPLGPFSVTPDEYEKLVRIGKELEAKLPSISSTELSATSYRASTIGIRCGLRSALYV